MRTGTRKRRPATSPDDTDAKRLTVAGPEADPLSTDSGSSGDVARATPAENDSISSRLPPISVTKNGLIDVEKLRSGTKERLKVALSDPDLGLKLGIAPLKTASDDDAKMMAQYVAPALFGALNALLTSFPRRYGYTAEAAQVMAFDGTEIAQMAPQTGKVLAKYLGGQSKYQDEMLLGVMVLSGIMAKVTLLEKQATVLRLQRTPPATAATTPAADVTPTPDPAS